MKKNIITVCIIVLVVVAFGFFSKETNQPTIGKPQTATASDGRPLYSLSEQKITTQDFMVSGSYLVFSGRDTRELYFNRHEDGVAVFFNSENKEESFSNKVLLALSPGFDKKEIEDFLKKDTDIVRVEFFDAVGVVSLEFENPYVAYIKHLEYFEYDVFISSNLDFTVTTMHNEDIGI